MGLTVLAPDDADARPEGLGMMTYSGIMAAPGQPIPPQQLSSYSCRWSDGSVSLAWRGLDRERWETVRSAIGGMERRPWTPVGLVDQPRQVKLEEPGGAALVVFDKPEVGVTVLQLLQTGAHAHTSLRIVPGSVPVVSVRPRLIEVDISDEERERMAEMHREALPMSAEERWERRARRWRELEIEIEDDDG